MQAAIHHRHTGSIHRLAGVASIVRQVQPPSSGRYSHHRQAGAATIVRLVHPPSTGRCSVHRQAGAAPIVRQVQPPSSGRYSVHRQAGAAPIVRQVQPTSAGRQWALSAGGSGLSYTTGTRHPSRTDDACSVARTLFHEIGRVQRVGGFVFRQLAYEVGACKKG